MPPGAWLLDHNYIISLVQILSCSDSIIVKFIFSCFLVDHFLSELSYFKYHITVHLKAP
jgi:hypothetical protein